MFFSVSFLGLLGSRAYNCEVELDADADVGVDVDVDAAEDDDECVLADVEAFVGVAIVGGDKGADFWIDSVLDDNGCVDGCLNWAMMSVVVGSRFSLRPLAALLESRRTTCSVTITTSTTGMLAFFLSLSLSSVATIWGISRGRAWIFSSSLSSENAADFWTLSRLADLWLSRDAFA